MTVNLLLQAQFFGGATALDLFAVSPLAAVAKARIAAMTRGLAAAKAAPRPLPKQTKTGETEPTQHQQRCEYKQGARRGTANGFPQLRHCSFVLRTWFYL